MPPNSGYRPSSEPRSTPPIGISASASSGEIRARSRRWYDPLRRVWASRPPPEQVSLQHHIGGAYNATNNNHGPVTTIQHASNLTMVSQGASDDWLLLEGLPRHPDISAEWRELVPHSRDTDLGRIWQYIDSPIDKDLILWIHGPPGIGKSALARQLKDDLRSRNRLAASIFLSRLFIDPLGPETLIRLIGGEIGRTYRQAVSMVAEAVRLCHGTSLSFHVEKFIRDPLLSLQLPHPLIIIIDGVTEWTSHAHFIEQLSQLAPYTSLIRFIILGRSEPPRDARYKSIPIRSFKLAPISVELMAGCLNDHFDTIRWKDGRRPTEEDVLRLANMADGQFTRIEELVSLVRELPPSNYDDISEPISRLAASYRNNFKKSGSVDEIDRAILLGRVALALRPSGHPERHSAFHNLATSLGERYNKSNSTEDLEERILLHREALSLRPPGHPYRQYSFHNLAKSLHDRFLKGGVISDLEEAITLGREELRLRPEGHPNRCSTLLSQRIYLHDLFKMTGAVEDLQEAITLGEEALAICPKDHSHYATLPAAISSYKAKLAQLPASSGGNSSQSNQT